MTRGKVFRDTNAGPGVISIGGVQRQFTLEANWKGSIPPKVGQTVDVELQENGEILSAIPVDENTLVKEAAEQVLAQATSHGKAATKAVLSRLGVPAAIAMVITVLAWFVFPALSIRITGTHSTSFTIWNIAGLSSITSTGIQSHSFGFYSVLTIAAMIAPLSPYINKSKWAYLGQCVPLVYLSASSIIIYLSIRSEVQNAAAQAKATASLIGGRAAANFTEQLLSEMLDATIKAISIGSGFYIALLVAAYFLYAGARGFLLAHTTSMNKG